MGHAGAGAGGQSNRLNAKRKGTVHDPVSRGLVRVEKLRKREAMLAAAPKVEDWL